jgi:hypothetical protein
MAAQGRMPTSRRFPSNLRWLSPERVEAFGSADDGRIAFADDMYSYGVVCIEVALPMTNSSSNAT